jgi:fluoride exporter
MSVFAWLGVGLLGGVGAVARFHLDGRVQARRPGVFPAGTLVVNVVGTFALGAVVGAGVGGTALLLVGTALLGSFTTFSTWMLETERLGEEGEDRVGLLNVFLPLGAGLAAAAAGWALGAAL